MLEAFFNNEKSFSVFKYLLETEGFVSIAEVGVGLSIPPYLLIKILNNFDLLGMIRYKGPLQVALDLDNPIVLSICILDELLEKYFMDEEERERMMENGNFQRIIGDMDIANMSVLDFVECLKQIKRC